MKVKLTLLLLGLAVSGLFAFDGMRNGFILGIGGGFANVSYSQKIEGFRESDTETKGAFATDFKIGFAPSNKVEIYYSSQVAWFSITNIYGDNVSISDGIGTLSLSYFLSNGLNTASWAPSHL